MNTKSISGGVAHKLPDDLQQALLTDAKMLAAWESLTPLARNEWICWIVSVTLQQTRENHLKRARQELKEGKRRPCCWLGCVHRKDKKVSPSVQAILNKRTKKAS